MHRTNIGIVIMAAVMVAVAVTTISIQKVHAVAQELKPQAKAPIATSGDNNVYIAWWSNKTGNDEVMFKASSDGGKTFGSKMNLSNTPNSDSQDVQIAAAGSNVFVSWWERNQTMNEPVMRVSNDNGKSFGDLIMLSEK
ncbi:MAG TPA: hypothetical protein VJ729_02180 [Nitrososphaeraceae archaeon]|nr:hypothetical protein [Nitrososphaeraceae archaeon]